jgi:hypothetical protein
MTDHDGTDDCAACACVQHLFEGTMTALGGMSSNDAAFVLALLIHQVHTLAPDEDSASSFLVSLAGFMQLFAEADDNNETTPRACH